MLDKSNASELANIAKETGALVRRGQLRYTGPEMGDWEIGSDAISEILYQVRDREVLVILATIDGGEPIDLCGVCGFALEEPASRARAAL